MQILTGYFAKTKQYTEDGFLPISIARFTPKWFEGLKISALAPSIQLLDDYKKGIINDNQYTTRYQNELTPDTVLQALNTAKQYALNNNAKGVVFMCFEKPTDFCHRHLLADYCNKNFGTNIIEYSDYMKTFTEHNDLEVDR